MTTKERLHRLVDELPEPVLAEAEHLLQNLQKEAADPLLRALANAPEDDEPETEEERAAIAEARAAIHLAETKGREDVDVARKDRAAQIWCENATRLTGTAWSYLKVPQSDFDKLQPTTFADLRVFAPPALF